MLVRCWFMGSSQRLSGAGSWGAHGACQVPVGVVTRSSCQARVLVSAQRVRQSPVLVRHWYVAECEVLVRHRQPGRGGPCKFPNFPSPQELRDLGRIGGVTTLISTYTFHFFISCMRNNKCYDNEGSNIRS